MSMSFPERFPRVPVARELGHDLENPCAINMFIPRGYIGSPLTLSRSFLPT